MLKICEIFLFTLIVEFSFISTIHASKNVSEKKTLKRGTIGLEYGSYLPSVPAPWNSLSSYGNTIAIPSNTIDHVFQKPPATIPFFSKFTVHKHIGLSAPIVSPAEVEAAIKDAKSASANVIAAQQHVFAAKQVVAAQQHIASAREANAQAAQQRSEAAAQAQRAEATAAAQAVVLAQQRLAEAKAQVAAHQRIAAAKESHAAHVIQKSANAAALEIQRSEAESTKLAALQKSETAAIQHINAAKEANLAATSAAVSALPLPFVVPHYSAPYHPWGK